MGLINNNKAFKVKGFTTLYYHNKYNVNSIFFKKKIMGPFIINEGET